MPVRNPESIEVKDEGVSQGRVRSMDFVGSNVVAAVSGLTATITVSGGGGGLTFTTTEKDLGTLPRYSGTFDITGAGLSTGKPVLVCQAAGPYTNKGTLEDEAEMDLVLATGYVVNSTTIRVYWNAFLANGPLVGNVKFNYAVSG